jgi:hypothetical protein
MTKSKTMAEQQVLPLLDYLAPTAAATSSSCHPEARRNSLSPMTGSAKSRTTSSVA